MHKKVFVFGDSTTADMAGAKVVFPNESETYNPFGSKKTLIDDLKMLFGWRVGYTARDIVLNDFHVLKKIINQFKESIDEESIVVLGFGAIDAECGFFGKTAKDAAIDYFDATQNFFKDMTPNIVYIATTPILKKVKEELINLLPPNFFTHDLKTRNQDHLDFAKEIKNLCLKNQIMDPFNKYKTIEEKFALNYPQQDFGSDGYHFNRSISDSISSDGYHFNRSICDLIRLDLAKWIKENRDYLSKTPLETWIIKNDDPYAEAENIYENL